MDVNDLRSAVTATGLLLFLALVAWAWSRRRKDDFEQAAQLPFLDEAADNPQSAVRGGKP